MRETEMYLCVERRLKTEAKKLWHRNGRDGYD